MDKMAESPKSIPFVLFILSRSVSPLSETLCLRELPALRGSGPFVKGIGAFHARSSCYDAPVTKRAISIRSDASHDPRGAAAPFSKALQGTAAALRALAVAVSYNDVVADASAPPAVVPELCR